MNTTWFSHPLVWIGAALLGFGLCTVLPIRIKDERRRRLVYLLVLVPVSLGLIAYVYPIGIEVFKNWALGF